jgi:uncharacterized membrane protein
VIFHLNLGTCFYRFSPEEPSLAVLKGAVLFGHMPNFIDSRCVRRTYDRRIAFVLVNILLIKPIILSIVSWKRDFINSKSIQRRSLKQNIWPADQTNIWQYNLRSFSSGKRWW